MDIMVVHVYAGRMKSVSAAQFKQTCLRLLDEVEQTRESIIVTRRGKPVAQLFPFRAATGEDWGAPLRGSIQVVGDVVSPACTPEEWEGPLP
mgnify:CR=1 FL=1